MSSLMVDLGALTDALLEAANLRSVFAAALLEKFIPLLPSYVLFPAIGMSAPDLPNLVLRCIAATAGSIGGAAGWYLVGTLIGPWRVRRLVSRYGRWIFLTPRLYEQMANSYTRWPFGITFAGQLVPTVRIYQALPAGVLGLPLVPFLAATCAGSFCWILPLSLGGFLLRQHGWTASEAGVGVCILLFSLEGAALSAAAFRHLCRPKQE